jgi:repressor LexA
MRPVLTERQAEILLFIKRYSSKHGYSPSIRELALAMSIRSPNGIHCHLKALVKKGYLNERDRQKARSLVIAGEKDELSQARFLITAMYQPTLKEFPEVAELAIKWLKRNQLEDSHDDSIEEIAKCV